VQRIQPAWFTTAMRGVSYAGFEPQVYIVMTVVVLVLLALRLRWEAVMALFAAGVTLAGVAIKLAIQRPRPSPSLVEVIQQLTSYSFPSGHVLFYTAFFGFLFFLAYSRLSSGTRRALLLIILGSLVALVGLSRIELGQHWFSDVLAAYLLGSLWLALTIEIYRRGQPRFGSGRLDPA
jgi:undecaprenyl-diphosphatase